MVGIKQILGIYLKANEFRNVFEGLGIVHRDLKVRTFYRPHPL